MKNKFKFIVFALVCGMAVIAGCKKKDPTASIVGTWTFNTQHSVEKTDNVTTFDTTVALAAGTTATFTAQGTYITTGQVGNDTGVYALGKGTLTLTRNGSGPAAAVNLFVTALTPNNLVIESRDTDSVTPLSTGEIIYSLSR